MKIKICGLSRLEDIESVNEALPDYVGFVFYKKSRRYVTHGWVEHARWRLDKRVKSVGVFVNDAFGSIISLALHNEIDAVQLHGDEDAEYIKTLRSKIGGNIPIIKAVMPHLNPSYPNNADYLLFDGGKGAGKTFDWGLIPSQNKPFFLAGGINLENIAEAAKQNPYCIDVSGGAETDGVKDREKIIKLTEIVRNYNG